MRKCCRRPLSQSAGKCNGPVAAPLRPMLYIRVRVTWKQTPSYPSTPSSLYAYPGPPVCYLYIPGWCRRGKGLGGTPIGDAPKTVTLTGILAPGGVSRHGRPVVWEHTPIYTRLIWKQISLHTSDMERYTSLSVWYRNIHLSIRLIWEQTPLYIYV